MRRELLSS
ncbi:hypothetical protein LINPERPRIM_LOCUS18098 [Linum perenne]